MGSKKKQKQQAKKKPGRKSHKSKRVTALRTPFMAAFTNRFIRDPATKMPKFFSQGDSELVKFQNFAIMLGVLGEQKSQSNPVSGGTSSLRDQVIDFLNTAPQWPDHTAIPEKYKSKPGKPGKERMVHLVEIAVIADRILEAINKGVGGGGGIAGWPPH